MDRYDAFATAVGVFSASSNLVGLMRFLPSDQPFMVEHEFATLIAPGYRIRKAPDTAEVTRFTIAPRMERQGCSPRLLSAFIYKGLYQWSLTNGIRYLYFVVGKCYFRVLLRSGFSCEPIGPMKTLSPGGTECVAAILDWEQFRSLNRVERPAFLEWITTVPSGPLPTREPRRDLDSRREALSECS